MIVYADIYCACFPQRDFCSMCYACYMGFVHQSWKAIIHIPSVVVTLLHDTPVCMQLYVLVHPSWFGWAYHLTGGLIYDMKMYILTYSWGISFAPKLAVWRIASDRIGGSLLSAQGTTQCCKTKEYFLNPLRPGDAYALVN